MYGCIYKVTNIQNKKIYIGQTTSKNPKRYFEIHLHEALRNVEKPKRYFYNSDLFLTDKFHKYILINRDT